MWEEEQQSAPARSFPGGQWGVALAAALAALLVVLLLPMAWLERASWEMYLDRLVASARPPLGTTARLVAALLSAGLAGMLGWLLALWLRIVPSAAGFMGGWSRGRADDEADAPDLRSVDRHPDAPARRPFSAARDVVEEQEPNANSEWADVLQEPEETDELLLDAHYDERWAPSLEQDQERETRWDALEADPSPELAEVQDAPAVQTPALPAAEPAVAMPAEQPVAPPNAAAPLDLSVARLDELIARLERGLERKVGENNGAAIAAAAMEPPAAEVGTFAPAAAVPQPQAAQPASPAAPAMVTANEDPAFPRDPALAAALATLRRMNRGA